MTFSQYVSQQRRLSCAQKAAYDSQWYTLDVCRGFYFDKASVDQFSAECSDVYRLRKVPRYRRWAIFGVLDGCLSCVRRKRDGIVSDELAIKVCLSG